MTGNKQIVLTDLKNEIVKTVSNTSDIPIFKIFRSETKNVNNPSHEIHIGFANFETFTIAAKNLISKGWRLLAPVATDETQLIIGQKKIYFVFTIDCDALRNDLSNSFFILEWIINQDIDPVKTLEDLISNNKDTKDTFSIQLTPYIDDIKRIFNTLDHPKKYPHFHEDEDKGEKVPRYSRVVVGPVHAGVIQPGRFTFDLVGERIHRFKADLGYTSKGIEQLCEQLSDDKQPEKVWAEALPIIGSVAGDSSVAYQCAYCRAVEFLTQTFPCKQDLWLRAILLELERIANHINDIGLLARGVSFEGPATVFCVLREELRQWCNQLTGSRLLRNCLRLGGLAENVRYELIHNFDLNQLENIVKLFLKAVEDSSFLWESFWNHPIVQDRMKVGGLPCYIANDLAASGMVAKSVGIQRDCRILHPWGPYLDVRDSLLKNEVLIKKDGIEHEEHENYTPPPCGPADNATAVADAENDREVLSRFAVRIREVKQSYHLIKKWHDQLSQLESQQTKESDVLDNLKKVPPYSFHMGHCEAWRGDIFCWVMKSLDNTIFRLKLRDPSLVNWKVMEQLLNYEKRSDKLEDSYLGIACFPLINKSFNLSYSGNDL